MPYMLILLKHLLTYFVELFTVFGVIYGGVVTRHCFRYLYYFPSRRQDGAGIAIICISTEEQHALKSYEVPLPLTLVDDVGSSVMFVNKQEPNGNWEVERWHFGFKLQNAIHFTHNYGVYHHLP